MQRHHLPFQQTDVDPGMVHVDMRGSEFTQLDGIRTDYIDEVTDAINGLDSARADAAGRESNIAGLKTSLGNLLSTEQFAGRTEIIDEIDRLSNLETVAQNLGPI